MKKLIKKNKKGLLGATFLDFWAYVIFVFIVIIFYGFFSIQAKGVKESKIADVESKIKNDIPLINYLRTPYALDNNEITMADMLVLYYNEKDEAKKRAYYEGILNKTKEIFEPLEHCTSKTGITDKLLVGYAVYILDEESYNNPIKFNQNYAGTEVKKDKKFRTVHFFDGRIVEKSFGVIPNLGSNDIIHVGFFVSSVNTFGRRTENVKDC